MNLNNEVVFLQFIDNIESNYKLYLFESQDEIIRFNHYYNKQNISLDVRFNLNKIQKIDNKICYLQTIITILSAEYDYYTNNYFSNSDDVNEIRNFQINNENYTNYDLYSITKENKESLVEILRELTSYKKSYKIDAKKEQRPEPMPPTKAPKPEPPAKESIEKIKWIGSETQLTFLIQSLINNKLIANKNQWLMITQHFINFNDLEELRPFNNKQLAKTKGRSKDNKKTIEENSNLKTIDDIVTELNKIK